MAAEKQKVWYFEGDTVASVKCGLQMEVYKIYIDAWHGWNDQGVGNVVPKKGVEQIKVPSTPAVAANPPLRLVTG